MYKGSLKGRWGTDTKMTAVGGLFIPCPLLFSPASDFLTGKAIQATYLLAILN